MILLINVLRFQTHHQSDVRSNHQKNWTQYSIFIPIKINKKPWLFAHYSGNLYSSISQYVCILQRYALCVTFGTLLTSILELVYTVAESWVTYWRHTICMLGFLCANIYYCYYIIVCLTLNLGIYRCNQNVYIIRIVLITHVLILRCSELETYNISINNTVFILQYAPEACHAKRKIILICINISQNVTGIQAV